MTSSPRGIGPSVPLADLDSELDLGSLRAKFPWIGLKTVDTRPGALERLPQLVDDLLRRRAPRISVLTDRVRKTRRGVDITEMVMTACSSIGKVRLVEIPARSGRVHADESTLRASAHATGDASVLVSVGAGTVTDIAKAVAAQREVVAHVAVQTALSVNGYADDQSVVEIDGVKRTIQTRWPDALVADPDVLAEAPPELNAAGIGDLLAMFTAPADWQLASAVDMDDRYLEESVTMVRHHADALLGAAPRVRARDTHALQHVARLLTLSGISMGVARTTAPASGAEHTVSHMLDMIAARDGRQPALHGAQVGIAAVLASLIWRKVLTVGAAGPARVSAPSDSDLRAQVSGAFGFLDDDGAAARECWLDCRRKLGRWRAAAQRPVLVDAALLELPARWLAPPEALADALRSSGAPTRFSELDPPVPAARVRWALSHCHLLRDRFTVVDLVSHLGVWGRDAAEDVLAQADDIGAGL